MVVWTWEEVLHIDIFFKDGVPKFLYSNVILDAFYSYAKRCEHHGALNTLTRCRFHSFSKPEGALAQKVQNGLIEK